MDLEYIWEFKSKKVLEICQHLFLVFLMLNFRVEEKYRDVIFYESIVHQKTLVTDEILPENLILVCPEDAQKC